MRTALVLLLLLALAAIPGSVIPQSGVDSLKTSRWQDRPPEADAGLRAARPLLGLRLAVVLGDLHPADGLAGRLHRPALLVYWRGLRAQPPAAPRNLTRLPDHTSYVDADEDGCRGAPSREARRRARAEGGRRLPAWSPRRGRRWVAAERGYLREAGNLLFHLSVLVVLVGFAVGGLFGYKGGVILVVGNGFSNNLTQYDDFDPGSLFRPGRRWSRSRFTVDDFDVDWLTSGPRRGWRGVRRAPDLPGDARTRRSSTYDLQVNHPLTIGDTEVFLIGHGYAPVITIRDGNGDVAYSGPTIFLPQDAELPVLRRGQGAGRQADPDRARGPVLPDVR